MVDVDVFGLQVTTEEVYAATGKVVVLAWACAEVGGRCAPQLGTAVQELMGTGRGACRYLG